MVASIASPSPQSLQTMSETRPPLRRVPHTLADPWMLTKPIIMKIQIRPRAKLKGFPQSKSHRALKKLSRQLAKAAHNPVEPSSRLQLMLPTSPDTQPQSVDLPRTTSEGVLETLRPDKLLSASVVVTENNPSMVSRTSSQILGDNRAQWASYADAERRNDNTSVDI